MARRYVGKRRITTNLPQRRVGDNNPYLSREFWLFLPHVHHQILAFFFRVTGIGERIHRSSDFRSRSSSLAEEARDLLAAGSRFRRALLRAATIACGTHRGPFDRRFFGRLHVGVLDLRTAWF